MSYESFLSLAEIKAIKCIHCLRDLILNLIFLLHCWWNYKGTISKKKNQQKMYLLPLPLLLECWKWRMLVGSFLHHSKKDWERKCSSGQIFSNFSSSDDHIVKYYLLIFCSCCSLSYFSLVSSILSSRIIRNICNNT